MDVVWNCAYGMDVDVQTNPNLSFFVKMKNFLQGLSDFNPLVKILSKVKMEKE